MGRTMARSGTGAPLMKMMGLLADLVSEAEEEVLAGVGWAVELGMTLVPVPEGEPDPDPAPESVPGLVVDGSGTPGKDLEEPGKPGGPGVGCEETEGRLEDGKDGEPLDFPPASWRSRRPSRARRDEGIGGSILEMRASTLTHLRKPPRGCGGKADDVYLLQGWSGRQNREREQEACGRGGPRGDKAGHCIPPTPESVLRRASRDENRLLGLH